MASSSAFLLFSSPPNALGKGKNYKGVEEESGSGPFALQGNWERGDTFQVSSPAVLAQSLNCPVKKLLISIRGLGDKVAGRERKETELYIPCIHRNPHGLGVKHYSRRSEALPTALGAPQRTHWLLGCSWEKFRCLQDGILSMSARRDGRV
jgi:hypothetical protein